MHVEVESSRCFTNRKKTDVKGVEVSAEQAAGPVSETPLSLQTCSKNKTNLAFYERGRRCLNRQCLQNGTHFIHTIKMSEQHHRGKLTFD